jgi:hypothetical protein
VSVRSWLAPWLPPVVVATMVLAACSAGDGLRVEDGGRPASATPVPSTPSPSMTRPSMDLRRETPETARAGGEVGLGVVELRALLLRDPAVDADAKAVLGTCIQCLTRGVATDVIGSGTPQRIVTVKVLNTGWNFVAYLVGDVDGRPKVRSTIRGQDMQITVGKNRSLVVGSKVYGPTDRSCCPSGSKVEVYEWNGNYLVKTSEVFTKGS